MRILLLPVFLFATACVGKADFPSLAKRPIESQTAQAAPAAAPAPIAAVVLDAASLERIRDAVGRAEAGEAGFQSALGPAKSAVASASGAGFGSENWVAAQMAVSALERARMPLKTALTDLDDEARLIYEKQPNADFAPLAEASARLAAMDSRQSEQMDSLLARLRSR